MEQALDWFIVFSIKSTIVLLFALVVGQFAKKFSANTRSLVWSSTIYALLLLPISDYFVPNYNLGLINKVEESYTPSELRKSVDFKPKGVTRSESTRSEKPVVTSRRESDYLSFFNNFSTSELILSIWLGIAAIVYLRLLIGLLSIWWMAKRAENISNKDWNLLAIELGNEIGLKRTVKLLVSDKSTTPMTWGIFQPFILLPRQSEEWSLERLKLVLIHEMAHVKRKDFFTHMIAQLVSSLLWFNPMVWLITKQLISDREHACDDHVLEHKTKASDYASHLLEIAKSLRDSHGSTFASLCMAKKSQLEGRLLSILDDEKKHSLNSSKTIVYATVCVLLFALPLSAVEPWGIDDNDMELVDSFLLNNNEIIHKSERIEKTSKPYKTDSKKSSSKLDDIAKTYLEEVSKTTIKDIVEGNFETPNAFVEAMSGEITKFFEASIDSLTLDDLIQMKKYGVLPEFIEKLKKYGMDELSVDEVIAFAKYGVTAELMDEVEKAGYKNVSSSDLIALGKYGVSLEYIETIKDLGYKDIDLRSLILMSKYGVSTDLIKSMMEAGYAHEDPDLIIRASKYGVTSDFITYIKKYDKIPFKDVIQLSKYGADEEYISRVKNSSLKNADIGDIISMAKYGVDPSAANKFSDLGYKDITIKELVNASKYGLTNSLAKEIMDAGYSTVSFSELTKMAKYGVSSAHIRNLKDLGFKRIESKDIINAAKYDIDYYYLKELQQHGIKYDLDDAIRLAKYDASRHQFDILYKYNFNKIGIEDLINVAKYDLEESLIQALIRNSYKNFTVEDLVLLSKYDVDEDFIEEVNDAGYGDISLNELVKMKKAGLDLDYIKKMRKHKYKKRSKSKSRSNAKAHH